MNKFLDWVENAGQKNFDFHVETSKILDREATTTLTVFLTGAGAAAGYSVELIRTGGAVPVLLFLVLVSAYLFILAGALVAKCKRTHSFPVPTNEPDHLMQDQFDLDQVRRVELKNLQERLRQAATYNRQNAFWLDRIRLFAVGGVPAIAFVIFLSVALARLFASE